MDKYFGVSYKFFNSAMNLVDYMEKSSTSLLQLLEEIPEVNSIDIELKKNYENLLKRINKRSKSIKADIIHTIERQMDLQDVAQTSTKWVNSMNKNFERLDQLSSAILDSSLFVDKNGKLQQR